MRLVLKYLLPSIVCVVLWGCADKDVSDISVNKSDIYDLAELYNNFSIDQQETEFCLPRQVSFANTQRVQSGARRTNSLQRNNFEFAKAGKVMNAGLRYFVQINSIITRSSHVAPSYRLLSLGRLII